MKKKQLKACSFLPAATHMIHHMGLEELLYGVTFECVSDKPKIVRSHLEGNSYSSEEIETIVSKSKRTGKSLYYIDEDLLQEISPDIIFTQDVCDVCQIGTSYAEAAIHKLKKQPLVVPLIPRNLNHVYENAILIAKTLKQEEAAYRLLAGLGGRTDKIIDTLRQHNAPVRKVMIMEWMNPIYNCGHWIPCQVAQAGGIDMLANPSGYSEIVPWEKVRQYNPEVLVIAPCGFSVERSSKEVDTLTRLEGWNDLAAVKDNAVYLADADLFTCPSTHLVDGIELLASLFHPEVFPLSKQFKNRYISLSQTKVADGDHC